MKKYHFFLRHSWSICLLVLFFIPSNALGTPLDSPVRSDTAVLKLKEFLPFRQDPLNGRFWVEFPFYDGRVKYDHQTIYDADLEYSTNGQNWSKLVKIKYGCCGSKPFQSHQDSKYGVVMYQVADVNSFRLYTLARASKDNTAANWFELRNTFDFSETNLFDNYQYFYSTSNYLAYANITWEFHNHAPSNKVYTFRIIGELADENENGKHNFTNFIWELKDVSLVNGNPQHKPKITTTSISDDGYLNVSFNVPGFTEKEDLGTQDNGVYFIESKDYNSAYPNHYTNRPAEFMSKKNGTTPVSQGTFKYTKRLTWNQFENGDELAVVSYRSDKYITHPTYTTTGDKDKLFQTGDKYTLAPYPQVRDVSVEALTNGKFLLKWKVSKKDNAVKTDGFTIKCSSDKVNWREISNTISYNKTQEEYQLIIDYPDKNAGIKDYEFRIKRKDLSWNTFDANIINTKFGTARANINVNTDMVAISALNANYTNNEMVVSWTTKLGYSGANWYYKLTALTNNGTSSRVVHNNLSTEITKIADTGIIPCTPTQYKLELFEREGSSGTGNLVAEMTMTTPVVSPESVTGEISKFSVSKGYYNDRVNITWKISDNANYSRFTLSRKLRNVPDAPEVELYEISNTKKLYSYEDKDAIPGTYYDYTINAWADCSGKVSLVGSKSSIGFSQPFGIVSGRIAFEGSRPVQGVSVVAEGQTSYRNKSILLNANQKSYVETPYIEGMLSPKEFTFQAWIKPVSTATSYILAANGKYNLWIDPATNDVILDIYHYGFTLDQRIGSGITLLNNEVYQHLTVTYKVDEVNKQLLIKWYINGNLSASKIIKENETGYPAKIEFTQPAKEAHRIASENIYLGREGITASHFLNGYLDEVRVWKKALTDEEILGNYDRYISGKESDLALYYRFDESEGTEIFDLSCANGVFNEHHGTARGGLNTLRSEYEVPTNQQLAIKAISDANGYYIINTIPYTGNGNSFTITPILGVHQFEPSNRPLYFNNQSSTQNNIDFTDVSSFNVSGKVIYAGGNYPVEGCQFKVDGRILVNQDGQALTTNANGEFNIQVPIGIHELKVEKSGHTFVDGGLALSNSKNINYQNTITGLIFQDITRVKVIGHVTGGKLQHEKISGFGERVNNIGADELIFTAAKQSYLLRTNDNITSARTDTTFYHNNGEWTKKGVLSQDSTRMGINGNTVTIHVSPFTGEYVAWLYPERYTIENIIANKGTDQSNTVYDRKELLDLTDAPIIDEQMLKTSVRTWTDSVFVAKQGNQQAYWKKTEKKDTVKFHKEWGYYYQAIPSFTIQQMTDNGPVNYFGDKTMQLKEDENVAFHTETDGYTFGNPVFTQGTSYDFFLKAFELYENKLSTASIAQDIPPVAGGTVSISAGVATVQNPEAIILDENGEGIYTFIGGDPDLTTGIKRFNARVIIDNISYLPTNMANGEMQAYILGGRTTGTDFLTAASDKVDFVLHDPPGSESYAFLEKGSVHTVSETTTIADGVQQDASLNVLLGVDQYVLAGVGLLTGGETEVVHKVGVQEEITSKWINGNTVINTSVFTERVSTSSSTDFIGHAGDIFVGTGNNMLYGLTNNLDIKKKGELAAEDILIEAGNYALGRTTNFTMGLTFATRFYYTQSEIENIMIPKWKQAMENIFIFSPDGINVNEIKDPVYVSKFPKGHTDFAKPNNHPDFGNSGKILTVGCNGNCLEGVSYSIYFPVGFLKKWLDGMDKQKAINTINNNITEIETLAFTDTVAYYSEKIETWEKLLEENEKAKVDAYFSQNYSFGGGVTIEKSEEIESTVSTVKSQTIEASLLAGGETGFNIFGAGLEVIAHAGWVRDEEHTSSDDQTEKTVTGFVLQEDGALDELTVDFGKDPQHSTFIFRTRGGRSSCPYEGEEKTKYYEPGKYVLSEATMRVEVPRIAIAGGTNRIQVPAVRPATFTLNLTNESETMNDGMFRLVVDDTTNPDGAIIKIDGLPIGNGRLFMVPYGKVLTKTLTIEKGPNADNYENIRLLLVSDCQFDLTDLIEDVFDEVYVSVEFIPSCTDVKVISPVANWTANTITGDTLEVEIGNFDINYANFDHIDLQYRMTGTSDWNTLTSFFADQTRFNSASNISLKEMIPAGVITAKYKWNLAAGNVPDGQYEIRARSVCSTPAGVIVSECESEAVSGVKDMSRPMPLGNPSPGDGILNAGGEISLLFNEDIQTGMLTKNNFSVSGILNADNIAEPNVGLSFDGTGMAHTELPVYANGSFSIETWYQRKPGSAGALFAYGTSNDYLSLGFDATGKAIVTLGSETYVSTAVVANDETWKYIALSYNRETNTVSVYGFQGSNPVVKFFENKVLSTKPVTQGKLYVGNTANAYTGGLQGAIGGLHFYSTAHTAADASQVKSLAKAGNEPDLIGYWELTEGEGTVAKDKARAHDWILKTNWYVYPSGKSLEFNGINQYATIPSGTFPFRSYDDFTIEFCFKGGAQGAVTLFNCNDMSIGIDGNKQLRLITANGTQLLSTINLLNDQWHHIALSVKRSGNSTSVIDGKSTASFNSNLLNGEISAANYYLGVKRTENTNSEYFRGNIDEIRIWRSALPNDAIRLNKNNKLRGDEPGLVAYYPFEKYTKQANGLVVVTESNQDMLTKTLTYAGTAVSSDVSPAMQDCRPLREVPFEFTASNNKIVINLAVADYLSEGVALTITSKGVRDMHSNIGDPVIWTAYVNRNALKWDTDEMDMIMAEGGQQSFKAVISNRSGENTAYYIENIPGWITLANPTGNLKPLENKELTFNVQQGVNIGNYEASIVLTGTNNVREILPVRLKVTGKRPDWAVNSSDFESSMNITGQIKVENIYQEDEDDVLAAFIGDICVGVTSPKYIKSSNAYFTFADIYGNKDHNSKELTFKYWDASTGRIYPKVTTSSGVIRFGTSTIVGGIKNPVIFNVLNIAEQQIGLNKGWSWISSNVTNTNPSILDQMKNSLSQTGVMIKGRNTYLQQPNWLGNLTGISEKSMYLVNTNQAGNLALEGQLVNPSETPISVNKGWNWIGYVPSFALPVNNALAGINAQADDQIKGQSGYAVYVEDEGWIGSLTYMQPGKGYMYHSNNSQSQTLLYPSISSVSNTPVMRAKNMVEEKWSCDPSEFSSSMTITLTMSGITLSEQIEVAAFCGNECRGSAFLQQVETGTSSHLGFLTVYGNIGHAVSFKVYDHVTAKEYTAVSSVKEFITDAMYGSPANPEIITINTGTDLYKTLADILHIYPNPVKNKLHFSQDQLKLDVLEITNLSGQLLVREIDFVGNSLDVSYLGENVYFLRVIRNDEVVVLKFIKE